MSSRVVRTRIAHGSTRLVAVALALTGFAAIVGVIVTTLGAADSYRAAVAGTMWFTGFIAVLESEISWILIPAGLVVIAIGTIVYVL